MKKTNIKNAIRKVIDVVLTALLLCLTAYQVMDGALHEWIGIGMTVILIVHHILNIKWYAPSLRENTMLTGS